MPKIVTVEQMRAIEQAADAAGHSYIAMMQRAGRAVADCVLEHVYGGSRVRIVILVGPGNNGGDGLVAGRLLVEALDDAEVSAYLLKLRDDEDGVFTAARAAGVTVVDAAKDKKLDTLRALIADADVIIDALFGTSLRLPIKGSAAAMLEAVNTVLAERRASRDTPSLTTPGAVPLVDVARPLIVAVDCPSGADCDTGALDERTIPADHTVTFAAAKPGLLAFPGAEAVGTLHIGDIGLPPGLDALDDITLALVDAPTVAATLPARPRSAYKGTFGKALVVAGSLNYTGAAYMAAAAAYRAGAGWVTVAAPQIIVPVLAGMLPEATWVLLPHDMGVINPDAVKVLREEQETYTALLIGPGIGSEDVTGEFLRELLMPEEAVRHARALGFVPAPQHNAASAGTRGALPPLVLDASALLLLAAMEDWPALVPQGSILTPHPGEFAKLAGVEIDAVQADRVGMAQQKAAEWHCVVVLKGAFTVVAAPDGRTAVLPFATPALARAGTGDVLAGAIVGLRAQGVAAFEAAMAGAYLHGLAGVRAGELVGVASVTAGDVLELLPDAYTQVAALRA